MNIIFFGSDDFAAAHLKVLINSDHDVMACVTQPDRPKGRGMNVAVSPIKECAQRHSIPVLQPSSLQESSFIRKLKDLPCDLFVVIAYGKFLPKEMIDIPRFGAINVHASLLPKYRGAAPINWAIINGEKETGLSIIKINEQMDAGDILDQLKINISQEETAVTLRAKMINEGPGFLLKTIDNLESCTPIEQDSTLVTLAPKLTKDLGHIQWTKQACEIGNLIRGVLPWPGAYTFYKGKSLKILEAQGGARHAVPLREEDFSKAEPGTVSAVDKGGITMVTGSGELLIKKVHLQDSKPMDAHSFVVGHRIETGYKFK